MCRSSGEIGFHIAGDEVLSINPDREICGMVVLFGIGNAIAGDRAHSFVDGQFTRSLMFRV